MGRQRTCRRGKTGGRPKPGGEALCLFCNRKHYCSPESSAWIQRTTTCKSEKVDDDVISDQLRSIFVLRSALQLEEEMCCELLQKYGGELQPAGWFSLCEECDDMVQTLYGMLLEVKKLERKVEDIRGLLKRKLYTSCGGEDKRTRRSKKKATNSVCIDIRQLVMSDETLWVSQSMQPESDMQNENVLNASTRITVRRTKRKPAPIHFVEEDPHSSEELKCDVDKISNSDYTPGSLPPPVSAEIMLEEIFKVEENTPVETDTVQNPTTGKGIGIPRKIPVRPGQVLGPAVEYKMDGIKRARKLVQFSGESKPRYVYRYKCSLCPAHFQQKHALEKHSKLHESGDGTECPKCSKVYTAKALSYHLRKHSTTKLKDVVHFYCDYCPLSVTSKRSILRHFYQHHQSKALLQCFVCDSKLETQQLLQIHMEFEHSIEEEHPNVKSEPEETLGENFQGDHCHAQFPSRRTLDCHKGEDHKDCVDLIETLDCLNSLSGVNNLEDKSLKNYITEDPCVFHDESPAELVSEGWSNFEDFTTELVSSEVVSEANKDTESGSVEKVDCSIQSFAGSTKIRKKVHRTIRGRKLKPVKRMKRLKVTKLRRKLSRSAQGINLKKIRPAHYPGTASASISKCSLCPATFRSKSELIVHQLLHDGGSGAPCPNCGKFYEVEQLDSHIRLTHSSRAFQNIPYYCDHCPIIFISEYRLLNHVQKWHSSNGFLRCSICNKQFATKQLLQFHREEEHPSPGGESTVKSETSTSDAVQKDLQCAHCPLLFSSQLKLDFHLAKKHRASFFTCRDCGHECNKFTNFQKHLRRHKSEKLVSCELCCKRYADLKGLEWHRKVEHAVELGLDVVACDKCDLRFGCQKHLEIHVRDVHEARKQYCCEFCGKGFVRICDMKQHILLHTVPRELQYKKGPFTCEYCQAQFNVRQGLYYHLKKLHSDKYLHRCEHCGKGYCSLNSIIQHKKSCTKIPKLN